MLWVCLVLGFGDAGCCMTAGDWFACFVAGGICFTLSWVCLGSLPVVDGLCFLLDYCFVYLDLLIVLIFVILLLKCFVCW